MSNSVIPRSEHPRPQLFRPDWINLNGEWTFQFDPGRSGIEEGLGHSKGFREKILVPFCPESTLSGVGYKGFIEAMFYHRTIRMPGNWSGKRILLHFGAVNFECSIYLDGVFAGQHSGGSASFEFDVTKYLADAKEHDLVVSVKNDIRSGVQPSGKQSAKLHSDGCFYSRVTGIWQTVWLEAVGTGGLRRCRILPDLDGGSFVFIPEFFEDRRNRKFAVTVRAGSEPGIRAVFGAETGIPRTVALRDPRPWSPEDPFLYDVTFEVFDADGNTIDRAESYAGLRKIHTEGNRIYLNNKELFLRAVLDQGYYPDGLWTAPDDASLKRDIELAMSAGFNSARLHQKIFEERFHYWADRLGYLTSAESPSWGLMCFMGAIRNSPTFWESEVNFLSEWKEAVLRDANHPSILLWTPANETWSCYEPDLYRRLIQEVYRTTKMLDPGRSVNDCSGHHHIQTDIWSVHLYRENAEDLTKALAEKECGGTQSENHKRLCVAYEGQPYLNNEFGGFLYIPAGREKFADNSWGHCPGQITNEEEFLAKIAGQIHVMLRTPELSGYCYTQLTDVEQEQNGVFNYDRSPKVPPEKLAAIFGRNPERIEK